MFGGSKVKNEGDEQEEKGRDERKWNETMTKYDE